MEVHDKFYKIWLTRFCSRLSKELSIANYKRKTKAAFVVLIVRDSGDLKGNVDIGSSLTTESIVRVLTESLIMANKDLNNNK